MAHGNTSRKTARKTRDGLEAEETHIFIHNNTGRNGLRILRTIGVKGELSIKKNRFLNFSLYTPLDSTESNCLKTLIWLSSGNS